MLLKLYIQEFTQESFEEKLGRRNLGLEGTPLVFVLESSWERGVWRLTWVGMSPSPPLCNICNMLESPFSNDMRYLSRRLSPGSGKANETKKE